MASGEALGKIGDLLSQVTARSSIDDVGGPGSEIEAVIRLDAAKEVSQADIDSLFG